ncbi:hypothetical protein [Nocardia brasiliensis]|uniref:hypothetical protein n=1 Tax=Nocardia brasiliensis TaxID=37326 RepID=UPI0036724253
MDDVVQTSTAGRSFIRFQAGVPNRRGRYPGVFALVNGLSWAGRLSVVEEQYRLHENAWYHAHLVDPSTVDRSVYDQKLNPGASAWFKSSALEMIARARGYLMILDAHEIEWTCVDSDNPGEIVYDDAYQTIAKPVI